MRKNNSEEAFQVVEHSWENNTSGPFYDESELDQDEKKSGNNKIITYQSRKRKINKGKNNNLSSYKNKSRRNNHKKKYIRYYKIKSGDTIYGISKKFNIDQKELCRINKINNTNKIKRGLILKIPNLKYSISKKNIKYDKKVEVKEKILQKPEFVWPLKNIKNYENDGINGVKSIGIIITGKSNAPVISSAAGIVKKIGYMRGFGNYVIIKHEGRFATVYSNLKNIIVKEGEKVRVGIAIGSINKKLHFQIDYGGKPDNPLKYLPKNS